MPAKKSEPAPAVILCTPLYGQRMHLTPEERAAARKLVYDNRNDPAVKALFNLIERKAFDMQRAGIEAEATAHDQGQACGALYTYQVARAWLESPPQAAEQEG
jgi:hypothetical protein